MDRIETFVRNFPNVHLHERRAARVELDERRHVVDDAVDDGPRVPWRRMLRNLRECDCRKSGGGRRSRRWRSDRGSGLELLEDDRSSVVSRLFHVSHMRTIAERERLGLVASAEAHHPLILHPRAEVVHIEEVHSFGRIIRRHGGPHAVVVRARAWNRLCALRRVDVRSQPFEPSLLRRKALEDERTGVIPGRRVVLRMTRAVAVRKGWRLVAAAQGTRSRLALLRELLNVQHIHALRRVVRRHRGRHVVVVGSLGP
mmetsp:Transcript_24727/g.80864  ORF Transcript_24727/g.80864 Transcript_24727/m.80864 type:complete len:257 (-) Transcript_24727:260-1030(-)